LFQTTCSNNEDGWGRKKRQASNYEDVIFDDVNVGISMSVGTDIDVTPTREFMRSCSINDLSHRLLVNNVFHIDLNYILN